MSVTMENDQVCADGNVYSKMESNDIEDALDIEKSNNPSYEQVLAIASTEKYAHYYNMNHAKRGEAIIFNHTNFNDNYASPRLGTDVDCKTLVSTFHELGFEVTDYHNLTHDDIVKHLERIASLDHSQHDCLVVAFLTHGVLGKLYAYDTRYEADTIWSYFTSDKCPTLAGKPKLFFIQACRGKRYDDGTLLEEKTETDGQLATTTTFRIPTHADFLIAYSTVPGFYSWRNTTCGTWFIQSLCMELRENGTRYDILTLLTFVSQRVALDFESKIPDKIAKHEKKQIPCITSMLTRLVKFTPKNITSLETNAIDKNITPLETNAIDNSK